MRKTRLTIELERPTPLRLDAWSAPDTLRRAIRLDRALAEALCARIDGTYPDLDDGVHASRFQAPSLRLLRRAASDLGALIPAPPDGWEDAPATLSVAWRDG